MHIEHDVCFSSVKDDSLIFFSVSDIQVLGCQSSATGAWLGRLQANLLISYSP